MSRVRRMERLKAAGLEGPLTREHSVSRKPQSVTGRRKKKLLPFAMRVLPKRLRHALMRHKATIDPAVMCGVVVDIAHTKESYEPAFRLVHDAYVWRGWIKPQATGQYLTEHHALPETTVFVLRKGTECLGTISLVLDSPLGLPIDHTFPHEVRRLRQPGRRLAEVGSFAVAAGHRNTGLTMYLIAAVWRYARQVAGLTDLVIAVDDHVLDYYEGLFGFQALGAPRVYRGFGADKHAIADDLVVGVHHDLTTADQWLSVYDSTPPNGRINPGELAYVPYPSPWEVYPRPGSTPLEEARYKLPRPLFQELFMGPGALQPLGLTTEEFLLQCRTPQTVIVKPRTPAKRAPHS